MIRPRSIKRRWIMGIMSLLIVVLLAACAKREAVSTWEEQYDLGMKYLSEGKYEEAIIAFSSAIEIDPKQEKAYIGLAKAYESSGDIETAKEVLLRGIEATEAKEIVSILDELEGSENENAEGSLRKLTPVEGYPKTVRSELSNGGYMITEWNEYALPIKTSSYDVSGAEKRTGTKIFNEYGQIVSSKTVAQPTEYTSYEEVTVDYIYSEDLMSCDFIYKSEYSDGESIEGAFNYQFLEPGNYIGWWEIHFENGTVVPKVIREYSPVKYGTVVREVRYD